MHLYIILSTINSVKNNLLCYKFFEFMKFIVICLDIYWCWLVLHSTASCWRNKPWKYNTAQKQHNVRSNNFPQSSYWDEKVIRNLIYLHIVCFQVEKWGTSCFPRICHPTCWFSSGPLDMTLHSSPCAVTLTWWRSLSSFCTLRSGIAGVITSRRTN